MPYSRQEQGHESEQHCQLQLKPALSYGGVDSCGRFNWGRLTAIKSPVIQCSTDDELQIEHGSLYPALHRLERKGWLASKWESDEREREFKYYRLTSVGKRQLAAEESKWYQRLPAVQLLVSGLWTNSGVGSSVPNEQRGSLEASNMTMETFFQQPNQNCFTCHNYDQTQPLTVSHIISDLLTPADAPKRVKPQKQSAHAAIFSHLGVTRSSIPASYS
jgi:DNA-binding PadR family transcriptional regulator